MMDPEVIRIKFMGQDSMGRVWNKVGVSGEAFQFFLGHVDQDLMDNIDRGS